MGFMNKGIFMLFGIGVVSGLHRLIVFGDRFLIMCIYAAYAFLTGVGCF